jgi:hypothetical protein
MNRPINKCATRACPMLGYWHEGEHCPEHRHDGPARPPMPYEIEASASEYQPW